MFIFDSLNMYLLRDSHFAFIKNNAKKITKCNKKCQGNTSVVCGHYCLSLAHFIFSKISPDHFLNQFGPNTAANDEKVLKWVSKNFGEIKTSGGGQACISFRKLKKKIQF